MLVSYTDEEGGMVYPHHIALTQRVDPTYDQVDEFSFVRDLGSKPIYVVGEEEERRVFTFIGPCMCAHLWQI